VNHRIFERTLRSLVFRGACLFECHEILNCLLSIYVEGVKLELEDNCWRNSGCLLAPLKWMSFSDGSWLGNTNVITVYVRCERHEQSDFEAPTEKDVF
jgi:hypothetical protein